MMNSSITSKNRMIITVASFFLLTMITVLFYNLSVSQGGNGISYLFLGGGDDGLFYYEQAININEGYSWISTSIYPVLLASVMSFFGSNHPLILRLFNVLGFMILIFFKDRIIFEIVSNSIYENKSYLAKRIQYSSTLFLTLYLSLVMNLTVSLLRDIWIFATFEALLYISLKMRRNRSLSIIPYIGIFITLSVFLFNLREYALIAFLIGYILNRYTSKKSISKKSLFYLLLVFVIYYTFARTVKLPFINLSFADGLSYRFNSTINNAGGSQLFINLNQDNVVVFLFNLFYSLISNLVGPLVWQVNGVSTLAIFVFESIPMVYMLYYSLKNKEFFPRSGNILIWTSMAWFIIIAVINDNLGTASRLRILGWINIIIIYSFIRFYKKEGYNGKNNSSNNY